MGSVLGFAFPHSGLSTSWYMYMVYSKDLSDRRILDQESLIDKEVKIGGSDEVLILPMEFIQHNPCLSSQQWV